MSSSQILATITQNAWTKSMDMNAFARASLKVSEQFFGGAEKFYRSAKLLVIDHIAHNQPINLILCFLHGSIGEHCDKPVTGIASSNVLECGVGVTSTNTNGTFISKGVNSNATMGYAKASSCGLKIKVRIIIEFYGQEFFLSADTKSLRGFVRQLFRWCVRPSISPSCLS